MQKSRFDPDAIAEIWGSSTDRGYRTVLGVFALEAGQLGAAIETALTSDDMEALHYAAHTLKGAAANVGAVRLSAFANDLAEQAADGRVVASSLPPLRSELRALLDEIGGAS